LLKIGIDIDNTINIDDNSASFFSLLTHSFKDKAEIHVITRRNLSGRDETIRELDYYNIYYDFLEMTEHKARYILAKGISIFFEDTDEYFQDLGKNVLVLKPRESGNYDFNTRRWLYDGKTGKEI